MAAPFPLDPGDKGPVGLLLSQLQLLRLEPGQVEALGTWVEELAAGLDPEQLKEPTIGLTNYQQHASSVIDLAVNEWATVADKASHYERERLDALAQVLVAAYLIQRFRRAKDRRETTVEEAQAAGEARGWSTLEDAITTLKDVEDDLVTKGNAALIDHPKAQALQTVLACALKDRPEHSGRIAGKYWRRVDSFARRRRPRKQPVGSTEAAQPVEPTGGTPETA